MAGFFSKASSFLSSQANDQKAASHGGKEGSNEDETRNSPSSGGYGDLLAGAQELINSAKPSDGESVDKEEHPHKAPASSEAGGYGDLLESAQSFMATSKPSAAGGRKPDIKKEGDGVDKAPESGGYGDLLASAQEMMGSAKLGSGESKNVADAPKTTVSSGEPSSEDMYASAQVLMGAIKASREGGAAADMGEVAGATANLIGAGTRYGDLEKTAYGDYAHKAQTYLQDYQASHAGKAPHKLPSSTDDQDISQSVVSKPQTPAKIGKNDEEKGSNPPLKNPNARSSEEDYN